MTDMSNKDFDSCRPIPLTLEERVAAIEKMMGELRDTLEEFLNGMQSLLARKI